MQEERSTNQDRGKEEEGVKEKWKIQTREIMERRRVYKKGKGKEKEKNRVRKKEPRERRQREEEDKVR